MVYPELGTAGVSLQNPAVVLFELGSAAQNPVTPRAGSQNPEGVGCDAQNSWPAAVRVLDRY
jgi:hypothetical protein